MEKRGIQTNIGNLNREIKAANSQMKSIRQLIKNLKGWIIELSEKRKELLADVYKRQTEMLFPQKGVRFIAINDGVDSAQGDNDFAPLRNIFNEWLVRDTSKKIKAVKRSKVMSGKPVTSKPVYGYLMDEDENFIID